MKKYKQASKNYQESLQELSKISKGQKVKIIFERLQHFSNKLKMKIGMCAYYQGQVKKAINYFQEQAQYYEKFNPQNNKLQSKSIKCNFYFAKAILAIKEKE